MVSVVRDRDVAETTVEAEPIMVPGLLQFEATLGRSLSLVCSVQVEKWKRSFPNLDGERQSDDKGKDHCHFESFDLNWQN